MIYRLNDEFTKIEESEGMLENKSIHTPVEIVMVNGIPEKDAGFELQPKEKMPFKVKSGESVYARCTNLDHMGANLIVANFNMPAMDESNAGCEMDILYSGLAAKIGTYNFAKSADQYKMLLITTPGHQCQQILPMGSTSGRLLKIYASTTYQINMLLEAYKDYFKITWASVSTEWGFNGIETIYGIK